MSAVEAIVEGTLATALEAAVAATSKARVIGTETTRAPRAAAPTLAQGPIEVTALQVVAGARALASVKAARAVPEARVSVLALVRAAVAARVAALKEKARDITTGDVPPAAAVREVTEDGEVVAAGIIRPTSVAETHITISKTRDVAATEAAMTTILPVCAWGPEASSMDRS